MREGWDSSATSNWLHGALHDLCQPLTTLECALYIGTMSPDGVRTPNAAELLRTLQDALVQCGRMTAQVRAIQDRLLLEKDGDRPPGADR